jgi:hypothetical protein
LTGKSDKINKVILEKLEGDKSKIQRKALNKICSGRKNGI